MMAAMVIKGNTKPTPIFIQSATASIKTSPNVRWERGVTKAIPI